LAVKVEDHPLEYGDFEGIIPEGNYGAGTVIVWDRGVWVPLEDVREGFEKGKLLFELRGYKLRGRWTLIKLKKTEKEWLLIKERDEYVSTEAYSNESVLSGLTNDELVVLAESGHPSFNRLQARAKLGAREAKRAAIEAPATLYVFDLLAFGGYDLRKLPLVKRKEILQKVLPRTGPLRYSEHFEKN